MSEINNTIGCVNHDCDKCKAQSAPVPHCDADQSELNDWFLSLPEGRQAVLLEDKWSLAAAAFRAGKAAHGITKGQS